MRWLEPDGRKEPLAATPSMCTCCACAGGSLRSGSRSAPYAAGATYSSSGGTSSLGLLVANNSGEPPHLQDGDDDQPPEKHFQDRIRYHDCEADREHDHDHDHDETHTDLSAV